MNIYHLKSPKSHLNEHLHSTRRSLYVISIRNIGEPFKKPSKIKRKKRRYEEEGEERKERREKGESVV
jgi:hypothetical protein